MKKSKRAANSTRPTSPETDSPVSGLRATSSAEEIQKAQQANGLLEATEMSKWLDDLDQGWDDLEATNASSGTG